MSEKTGAQILVDSLLNEGVELIFGYPGGVLLGIFDVLFDRELRFVLTRHEQGAAHAADGYARSTGKVGVCMATSGPGATNLVTGIASAAMDSVPIVAITGQVPTEMIGGDAFQEADIVGITRPITKHSYLVQDVCDIPRIIREAFYIASTGRPGPVLIDMPKDVAACKSRPPQAVSREIKGYKPTMRGNPKQIERAARVIEKASRPVVYAGGGVIISGAAEEIIELARGQDIPVTMTLLGLGGFPADDPLSLGMLGMHGTYYANMAVSESDLLIAIGARFDDRVTGRIEEFAPDATVIHVDIDPSAISKNVKVHYPIVGDVKTVLQELNRKLNPPDQLRKRSRKNWLDQISEWKKEHPLGYEPSEQVIKPQYVVEKIYEITAGEAIVCTEVGQNQMWAAQYYHFQRPRRFLSSGGLGTMGYGFPAAIGAQLGNPDAVVFDIAGDGSFQMNVQELATAVQNSLPVNVAILNNRFLGMVRQWQELFYDRRYSNTCLAVEPDFKALAEAYGARGFIVTDPADVEPVLKEAVRTPGPCIMDFRVDREENVFPMVPAGESIRNMMLGPEKKKKKKKSLKSVK
ncbi:MAG: biosynthetic-type acetolactate synthase large subunit [bacterium]